MLEPAPSVFGWLMDHAIDGIFLSTAIPLGAEGSGKAPATVSPDYHQPCQSLWIFTSALTIISVGHIRAVTPADCVPCQPGGFVPRVTAYLQILLFQTAVCLLCMIMRR